MGSRAPHKSAATAPQHEDPARLEPSTATVIPTTHGRQIRRNAVAVSSASGKVSNTLSPAAVRRDRGDKLHLAPDARLLPGLGCASVSKNGEPVIELQGLGEEHAMTVDDVERLAQAEPELEWCIHLVGLLDDRHYRRTGAGTWKLYARGYGLS